MPIARTIRHNDDFTDPHSLPTEIVMVVSETVFYFLLFFFLKKALVDERGMMATYDRMNENAIQLCAIFFAIFTILILLILPLHSYEYVDVVFVLTFLTVIAYLGIVINKLHASQKGSVPPPSSSSGNGAFASDILNALVRNTSPSATDAEKPVSKPFAGRPVQHTNEPLTAVTSSKAKYNF